MEEKKYYCVKLNGYNNKNNYYGLTKKNTLLDGVLKKEYSKLDKDNLDYDFLSLDSKVTSFKNSFLVEGFFPVIAEEVDGKLYDVITLEEIPLVKVSSNEFGYTSKEEISIYYVNLLLSLLDEDSRKRYTQAFNELKSTDFINIENYSVSVNNEELYAVKVGDKLYEKFTGNPLYEERSNEVNYGITYDDIVKSDGISFISDDYINKVNSMSKHSHKKYNIFVSCSTIGKVRTRK